MLLRLGRGLRKIHIERIKNSETGKVSYGTRGEDADKNKLMPLKDGLLAFIKEHADDRLPIQSELWLTIHHDEGKAAAQAVALAKMEAAGDSSKPTDLAAEERKHYNLVWEGYANKDKDTTATDWSSWCKQRVDLAALVGTKYSQWVTYGSATASASAGADSTKPAAETDVSRYVKSQVLFTQHT